MPKLLIYLGLSLLVLAMIPPAVIARKRAVPTDKRRIHFIQDMDNQARFKTQQQNPLFADGRASRPIVPGTVARGQLRLDDHFERGLVSGNWATTFPTEVTVDRGFVEYGQERFDIYCQPCHGLGGFGDGIIHQRAMDLLNAGRNGTTWVAPKSIHEPEIREQPVGQIFSTITNGIRNMAGYKAQIPPEDRWAIVAYVKALQRSQNAERDDLSPEERATIDVVDMRPDSEDTP